MKTKSKSPKRILTKWFSVKTLDFTSNGERKAIATFQRAAKEVPAYGDFLKSVGINPKKIVSYSDFKSIPATTKENYIEKYPLETRCWGGTLTGMHMISTSSGTTGSAIFWPRNLNNEIDGASSHEYIFRHVFSVDKIPTLFLNGFAMGNWIAGTFTLACANLVSFKGLPLTTMTPGYSVEEVIKSLEGAGKNFGQVIIAGHTPFLKELLEQAVSKNISLSKYNIKLLGTGQSITENWRAHMIELLGAKDYFRTFINLYGSADASLMGFETPESIKIRKRFFDNPQKAKRYFADERLPSIYAFDPRLIFFESVNSELHITKDSGCPLIRYNIHDTGGLLPSSSTPLVYLFGREKFMVKIFGANIYTEHVQLALNHKDVQSYLTGRFRLEIAETENKDPLLVCRVEMSSLIKSEGVNINLIEDVFVREVSRVNSEYNFVLGQMKSKARPKIIIHSYGDMPYFPLDKVVKTA